MPQVRVLPPLPDEVGEEPAGFTSPAGIHHAVLKVVEEFFGLSLPREEVASGILPTVLPEPA
ncbi:hypothetical protein [Streptomyces sp. NPDC048243]|uniref:hypothetical protein n=1 Tax=Streptomyces sp. NPDC048243 TaxID=3365522 RepID=UPI0037202852